MKINNEIAKKSWENLGDWWDHQLGDGDYFHNVLIFPHLLKLISPKKNERILDLGCGNGVLARLLATKGANVLAVDFCESFLTKARARTKNLDLFVEYKLLDLTDRATIRNSLCKWKFDKAVCSLAIHAIADITPLVESLPEMLKSNGTVTLALLHPYFNSGEIEVRLPLDYDDNQCGILRKTYIKPMAIMRKGKLQQPIPHPNFHRPLSYILNQFFLAGFVLDECIEPTSNSDSTFMWSQLPEIPPIMILRFKLLC